MRAGWIRTDAADSTFALLITEVDNHFAFHRICKELQPNDLDAKRRHANDVDGDRDFVSLQLHFEDLDDARLVLVAGNRGEDEARIHSDGITDQPIAEGGPLLIVQRWDVEKCSAKDERSVQDRWTTGYLNFDIIGSANIVRRAAL